jgi:hypothetical protein
MQRDDDTIEDQHVRPALRPVPTAELVQSGYASGLDLAGQARHPAAPSASPPDRAPQAQPRHDRAERGAPVCGVVLGNVGAGLRSGGPHRSPLRPVDRHPLMAGPPGAPWAGKRG